MSARRVLPVLCAMCLCLAAHGQDPAPARQPPEAKAPAAPAPAPDAAWWDDRPIGVIMLGAVEYRSKTNPRGWFGEFFGYGPEALDARDPGYAARFAQRLTTFADRCVRWAKLQNCQAVVIWDLEGQEFDHPITYVGDPRILPPEMTVELAQAFCRKFTDAGIRIGGTVRPQVLLQTPYGNKQFRTGDPWVILTEKVNYARRVLGWRIFYVDSNTAATSTFFVAPTSSVEFVVTVSVLFAPIVIFWSAPTSSV